MKLFALLCLLAPAYLGAWAEHEGVRSLFERAEVNGTFVLLDAQTRTLQGYNRERADTRFSPASTFKIANALIGLSSGAVKSVDEVLPYTGPKAPFIAAWAEDMALRKAMGLSNVPIFQELARRIGHRRMAQGVAALGYGNARIGAAVDRFWLDGPLEISAVEQSLFLAALAQGDLNCSQAAQSALCDIMLLEQTPKAKLYGKTGWQNAPYSGVGSNSLG
ncbi:MAG: class D beta-lactamase [Campylobacterales bacterium]|nr:class D beta-lactamase [Campylobacterales bacterium]